MYSNASYENCVCQVVYYMMPYATLVKLVAFTNVLEIQLQLLYPL
jgi:hypothetical protein